MPLLLPYVDAFTLDWSQFTGYAFPPFRSHRALPETDSAAVSPSTNHSDPSLGNPVLVPSTTGNGNRGTSATAITPRATETRGQSTSSCPPTVSRVVCLRRKFQSVSISKPAQGLLLTAWRSRTEKAYSSAWRKWTSWCSEQQINPLSETLEAIVNFLAGQFDSGMEYVHLMFTFCHFSYTYTSPAYAQICYYMGC